MLSVKLSSKARGVDQMLLVECFKDKNCLNKDVLSAKDKQLHTNLTAEANRPRQQLGSKVVKIRSILKGYKKL